MIARAVAPVTSSLVPSSRRTELPPLDVGTTALTLPILRTIDSLMIFIFFMGSAFRTHHSKAGDILRIKSNEQDGTQQPPPAALSKSSSVVSTFTSRLDARSRW
jgi:hypothetical protein